MHPLVTQAGTFLRDLVASPRTVTKDATVSKLSMTAPYRAVKDLSSSIKLPRTGGGNTNVPPVLKGR